MTRAQRNLAAELSTSSLANGIIVVVAANEATEKRITEERIMTKQRVVIGD